MSAGAVVVAVLHAEKKAVRLRDQVARLQHQIDEVNAKHVGVMSASAQRIVSARLDVARAERALKDAEHDVAVLFRQVEKLQVLLRTREEHRPKLLAVCDMRTTEYAQLLLSLDNEQRRADEVLDAPRRHVASLVAKKEKVERRLALHLAREPLHALVPK